MKLLKIFHRKHTIAGRLTWRVVGTMTVVMTFILVLIFTFLWLLGAVILTENHKASTRVFNEKINNVARNNFLFRAIRQKTLFFV